MPNPNVLAIHDLSGFGHTSLMAVIPIMYRMGIEVATMPSALLSANTDHPGYIIQDNSDLLEKSFQHWKELKLSFDAIYTGFLGSPKQVALLLDYLPKLKKNETITLVDPVLADEGKLYSCYTWEMVEAMRSLLAISNLITPNWTEFAFLSGYQTWEAIKPEQTKERCRKLAAWGPRYIVVTSAPNSKGEFSSIVFYDADNDYYQELDCLYAPVNFPGSGDCFSAMLLAGIINGYSIINSIKGAIAFMHKAIEISIPTVVNRITGINLAAALKNDPFLFFSDKA
ncbi:MAG: pyridoxamine kinase [Candidatus Cloacimonetes bacterium]|nr:pyridoxamine kinase [Candidatus Cloacimonas sp.]MDD2250632.1 pyridoxamine kinase [Candidatus Cloacimonadota bacterium]MDD3869600.1 pyridoxamine kinase [Candidatus Cloacimonadota bacterium]MDD4676980.1 pyridoxamine kinase [Candidatus Cloacimonadota bacterium]HQB50253.1 pyridoxamine kinase [Candidatus Cloacimonas sp.]